MPSTINADNGVVSGSAGLKSAADSSGVLQLQTNGTTAVTVDTSQNVGVGTASPASKLHVAGSFRQTGATAPFEWTVNAGAADYLKLNAVGYADNLIVANSSGNVGIGTNLPTTKLNVSGGLAVQGTVGSFPTSGQGWEITGESATACAMQAYNRTAASWLDAKWYAGTHIWLTNGSERARIDSSGNLLVGTTTAGAKTVIARSDNDVVFRVYNSLTSGTTFDLSQVITAQTAGTGYNLLRLFTSNGGAAQFAVRGDGTVYAQNTTIQAISDIRAKENVRDADDGLQTILGLRPVRFDFKEGFGNNRKNQLGFIAQEMEQVFPDAVDVAGEKDENGDSYKSVGPSALIPVLVKAIQELNAKVQALESQLAAKG